MPRPPSGSVTLSEALSWGRETLRQSGIATAPLDAEILLAEILGLTRPAVLTRGGSSVSAADLEGYGRMLSRRAAGEPVSHLLGRKEFWSLAFHVDRRVLSPRPETEGVVEAALETAADGARVLDVGTGSGNILTALASEISGGGWVGLDISLEALAVARRNLDGHGLSARVSLLAGDLFGPLSRGDLFDTILSNPPYIPTPELSSLPREVRLYEPQVALDGGEDGLRAVRRIVGEAHRHLKRGGRLVMEVGRGQAESVLREIRALGHYRKAQSRKDLGGIDRIIVAERA